MEQTFTKVIDLLYQAKQKNIEVVLNKEELQVKLPKTNNIDKQLLEEIKEHKALISDFLKSHKKINGNDKKIICVDRSTINRIPLSFSQERLWFIDRLEGSVQYHLSSVLRLKGKLNEEALAFALKEVIRRHEVLRTVFLDEEGVPYQHIKSEEEWNLNVFEGREFKHDQNKLHDYIDKLVREPFDLAKDYMLRAHLIRLGDEDHVMVVVFHHIASDSWSKSVLVNELVELYGSYEQKREPKLLHLPIQYADYALWQRNYLQGEVLEKKLQYWKRKLDNLTVIELPTDFVRPSILSSEGASLGFSIDKHLLAQLQQLSHQHGATLFMTLIAVFKILLFKYCGQEDICVGTPIAGRQQWETERLIGFFINTLAIRSQVRSSESFVGLLNQVKENTLGAYEHQEVPFEKVVEALAKERDLGSSPFFQTLFVLQNTPSTPSLKLGEVKISPSSYSRNTSKFDLSVYITETIDRLQCSFQYSTDLFNRERIERMMLHYKELIKSVIENPHKKITDLRMISLNEEHQILVEFNNTKVEYPTAQTIVKLFEEQVIETPGNIALTFNKENVSFAQLNETSNRVAHYLQAQGVKKHLLVAIDIERSVEMIVGILGILKAGGTYLPIDAEFPIERQKYMLEDSEASFLLTNKKNSVAFLGIRGLEIIDINESNLRADLSSENPEVITLEDDIFCIIYTSGTTSRPKGVELTNKGIVNRLYWMWDKYPFAKDEHSALKTSISFVDHIWELFGPLTKGVRSVLFSREEIIDLDVFTHKLSSERITRCVMVPSLLRALLDNLDGDNLILRDLKYLTCSGEELDKDLIERFYDIFPPHLHTLLNIYGSSEVTADVTCYDTSQYFSEKKEVSGKSKKETKGRVPIGKPIANCKVYILDKQGNLVPQGVEGEICIGGVQVARGYLNHSDLAADKFISDFFNKEPNIKIYKTGDFGRWLSDGNIEYLGRKDEQIKIRGHRIEFAEIEDVVRQSGMVKDVVVLTREDKDHNNRLVAYLVTKESFDEKNLTAFLQDRVPEYMIPAGWMHLESMPMTSNGKIDKKALASLDITTTLPGGYVAARNEVEEKMVAIWEALLHRKRIGVDDNFFRIGGHSLLAMRVISAVRREFGVELTVKELFLHTTIASLAAHVQSQGKEGLLPSIKVQERPAKIPLSFSQEQLWFIDRLEGSVQYHLPSVLRLKGKLNEEALAYSLKEVVRRHEVLRTVFLEHEGEAHQYIKDGDGWELSVLESQEYKEDPEKLREYIIGLIKEPFDLSKDDMLRAQLIKLGDKDFVLVLVFHHIASDGWSGSILVKELVELYASYEQTRRNNVLPLPIQYADYAIWQRNYLQGEVLEKKLDYWRKKLEGLTALQIHTDYIRSALVSTKGASSGFKIDKESAKKLHELGQQRGATFFMTLLAIFKVLLYRYSDQRDISVGIPIAGRQLQELEELLGFFVNTLVLRDEVKGEGSFLELLQQVKTTTLEAFEHQDVPFEKVVQALVKERGISRNPLFRVMFVLQNSPEIGVFQLGEVQLSNEGFINTNSKFDIFFSISETTTGLQGVVEYCTDLYSKHTIERMIAHFKVLVASILKTPGARVDDLSILSQAEEHQLVYEFNNTKSDYPENKTVVDLFEEQVLHTPNNVAIAFVNEKFTYRELNEKANKLAYYLKEKGVKEETLVPICVARSLELIVGILGILKSGGAYVPLDVNYPLERTRYMLADTGADIVVCDSGGKSKLEGMTDLIILDLQDKNNDIKSKPLTNLKTSLKPHSLANVIYTSGSTGRPKGVLIEHRSVVSLVKGIDYVSLGPSNVLLSTGSPSFDATTFEIWGMLLNGGQLILCTENKLLDSEQLKEEIESRKVNIMWFTSSLFNKQVDTDINAFRGLKAILVGGEKLSEPHINKLKIKYPYIELINGYGPTENTTFSTTFKIKNANQTTSIPIGTPLSNRSVYILNDNGQLAPMGICGEIYLGGPGLARGYLNDVELTTNKFKYLSFTKSTTPTRLYQTGDIGRWLADGNIQFIGRRDDQVKIRGYRVELGEIESELQECKLLKQAVVLAKEDQEGEKQLIAYVVTNDNEIDKSAIITFMKKRLPDYMIPSAWVKLDDLPLTRNNKIDKKMLPNPEPGELIHTLDYVKPRNEVESKLVIIWQNLLKVEQIGIYDNFFELGGYSLLIDKVRSAIYREFKIKLDLYDIFIYPVIAELAQYLVSIESGLVAANMDVIKIDD